LTNRSDTAPDRANAITR